MSKAIQVQDPSLKQDISEKGIANGYVPLDSSTKIDPAYLNITGLVLMGGWDADTNTPTLGDNGAGGVVNEYYIVTVAGNTLIDGNDNWSVKDFIVNDGSVWVQVVNPDSVTSVFGRQGAVVAQAGDYTQTDVGLPNVDNTADIDKPISTDTQTALDTKVTSPLPIASETIQGIARIGTQAEVDAGLLNDVFVTPISLANKKPVLVDSVITTTYVLDCNVTNSWDLTIDENVTFSTVNEKEGTSIYILFTQGVSHNKTVDINFILFGDKEVPFVPYIENGFMSVRATYIGGMWLVDSVWETSPTIKFVSEKDTITVAVTIVNASHMWAFIESDGAVFTYTSNEVSHTKTATGNVLVLLYTNADSITSYIADSNEIIEHSSVTDLTALTTLYLNNNSLTDVGTVTNLTALTYLNLSNNSLTDIGTVTNLVSLTYLNLSSNSLTDIGTVTNLTALTYINLYSNSLTDIGTVTNLMLLTYISLPNNSLTDIGTVTNLILLTYINLSNNSLTDVGTATNLTSLTSLNLSNNSLTDIGTVTNLMLLTYINLSNNSLTQVYLDITLNDIYVARSGYTSPVSLLINANVGSPPSGVYQDATPPTTGLEFVFKLENDPDAEGFNLWSIVY